MKRRSDIPRTRHYGGQLYRLVGFVPHVTMDGRDTTLCEVASRCADCGAPFRFKTTPSTWKVRPLNRRCAEHKSPGSAVNSRLQQQRMSAAKTARREAEEREKSRPTTKPSPARSPAPRPPEPPQPPWLTPEALRMLE